MDANPDRAVASDVAVTGGGVQMSTGHDSVRLLVHSILLTAAISLWPLGVVADPLGGEPPPPDCCPNSSPDAGTNAPCNAKDGGSYVSLTEGNVSERVPIVTVGSAFGTTLDVFLTYNSYLSDGSQGSVTTVLGRGWTHSFNSLLFQYGANMFRMGPTGRVTKYAYRSPGRYTAGRGYAEELVKNPDGSFTLRTKDGSQYQFGRIVPAPPYYVQGQPYVLKTVTDRNGNVTTLTYSGGLLRQVCDFCGRTVQFNYNAMKKIASVVDPLSRTTTFGYGGAQDTFLTSITDPTGSRVEYQYNVLTQLIKKKDRNGWTFTYAYSGMGNPVAILDHAGTPIAKVDSVANWRIDRGHLLRTQERFYVPSTTVQFRGSLPWFTYTYDKNGFITQEEGPDHAITTFAYDPVTLRVAQRTNSRGSTTAYEYDGRGNVTKVTDALGNVTRYTYEPVFDMMTSRLDPAGELTRWTYDARGNRLTERDSLGNTRSWTYDARGNVLSQTDMRGNVTAFGYDGCGNRTSVTDALGHISRYAYDGLGHIVQQTDPRGAVTSHEYDALGRLVKTTDTAGGIVKYEYDGNGKIVKRTDRNGNALRFEYDHRGRRLRTIDALGYVEDYTYDEDDRLVAETDKNGHTTQYGYDGRDYRVQTTDPTGAVSTKVRDAEGNKLSETDENGNVTTFEYDALNRVVRTSNGAGCSVAYEYDVPYGGCCGILGKNLITRQEDANGKVTYFHYDALGRLVRVVRKASDTVETPDGDDAVSEYAYDPDGNMVARREPNGLVHMYTYNALSYVLSETNGAGETGSYAYDSVCNLVTRTSPTGRVQTYTYDALNRLVKAADNMGPIADYTLDPEGRVLACTDGVGSITSFVYDAQSRLVTETDALGNSTHYSYDGVGNLLTETDREGRTTSFAYDSGGRLVAKTNALGGVRAFQYDAAGNLVAATDESGTTTTYTYDGVNRLVCTTYANGDTTTIGYNCAGLPVVRTDPSGRSVAFVYDDLYRLVMRDYQVGPDDVLTYDLSGRLLSAERGGWPVTFVYDGADRVLQTTQGAEVVSYEYNVPARTRTIHYPGGRTVVERSDLRGRLEWVDDGGVTHLADYLYDAADRTVSRILRNGVATTYAYNPVHRMTEVRHAVGGSVVAEYAYGHNRMGFKYYEEHLHDPAHSEAYELDPLYRLTGVRIGSLVGGTVPVPLSETSYVLDSVSNWSSRVKDGVLEARNHNVANQITSIDGAPVLHDPDGSTTEDNSFTYAYDQEQRLVEVTRKSDGRIVARYQYDALGRRVAKVGQPGGAAVETRYLYDDARVIEEEDIGSATLATYVYGDYIDEVLTMDRGGVAYFYHANALWSVGAVTDGLGNVVERYAYDPYGQVSVTDGAGAPVPPNAWGTPHSAIGNPYLFTGRELDEEIGLYYYRARQYDAGKGRFLQRDPMGYVDSMNLYEYANSVPTTYVDPLGRQDDFVRQGSRARMEGGDSYPEGSKIKCPTGNEWRKEGDWWNLYKKKPPEPKAPPKEDPPKVDPPKAEPPKPDGDAEEQKREEEEECDMPGCPGEECPQPEPPKKEPEKPPEVKPPEVKPPQVKPPTPPEPPKPPKKKNVVVVPPEQPPQQPKRPRTAADWLEEQAKKYAEDNGLDWNNELERAIALRRALASAKAGGMTVPEALGELGGLVKQGAPSPGVSGSWQEQLAGEIAKWLWGP